MVSPAPKRCEVHLQEVMDLSREKAPNSTTCDRVCRSLRLQVHAGGPAQGAAPQGAVDSTQSKTGRPTESTISSKQHQADKDASSQIWTQRPLQFVRNIELSRPSDGMRPEDRMQRHPQFCRGLRVRATTHVDLVAHLSPALLRLQRWTWSCSSSPADMDEHI
jgi:hypothetical protein